MDTDLLLLFVRRAFRGDLQSERATDAERIALSTARVPITHPIAQDYAAWRRAVLWCALAAMSIYTLAAMISWIGDLNDDRLDDPSSNSRRVILAISTLLFLSVPMAAGLFALGAKHWTDLKRSRRYARWGWAILALTPVALSVIPWTSMIEAKRGVLQGGAEIPPGILLQLGAAFGLIFALKIGPMVAGICSGVIRSSLIIKTLVPASSIPGWAAVLFAPFYVILFLSVFALLVQMASGFFVVCGVSALVVAQAIYVISAPVLTAPCSDAEVSPMVRGIRKKVLLWIGISFACFLIAGFNLPNLDFWDVLSMMSTVFAGLFAITVVACDFLLALIQKAHRQAEDMRGTPLEAALKDRFAAFSEVGLDQMRSNYRTELLQRPDVNAEPPVDPRSED